MRKNTKKKIAPIIITTIIVLYMAIMVLLILGTLGYIGFMQGFQIALPFLLLYAFIGLAVIIGILLALRQRMKEINGGEEDESSQY